MPLQEKQYHRKGEPTTPYPCPVAYDLPAVAALGPDARMYAACIGGLLLPFGIFIFAFSQGRGHFLGPLAGLTIVFAGIFTIYSGMFSYLAVSLSHECVLTHLRLRRTHMAFTRVPLSLARLSSAISAASPFPCSLQPSTNL